MLQGLGATVQCAEDDTSRKLRPEEIKRIQKAVGKFLFLARAVGNTNPKPRIQFQASDMTLQIDSDAAFHVCPQARSRAGGYIYLGSMDNDLFNAPILVIS